MRKGIDAVALKRAAAAEAQKAKLVGETFADLAARYLESAARGDGMKRGDALAPRTLDEYRRILKADVLPALGPIAPREVAKAHVRALVDSIRAEGHAVHANHVLATVKSVFSWALRKDLISAFALRGPCRHEGAPARTCLQRRRAARHHRSGARHRARRPSTPDPVHGYEVRGSSLSPLGGHGP